MIFSWEFSKLLGSLIFCNIFICVEKLNYIKNYMKTRRETRKGGRASPHFVLRNRTKHLYYSRHRRSAKYERFIKTFLKLDQDRLNWKLFCHSAFCHFLLSVSFLFIKYLPRNSILCYASIVRSVLEEFRPVSA